MYNIRSRYRELTEHLKLKAESMGIAPENFQAEIARMVLVSGGHNETTEGWHLTNFRYRGVILVERIEQQKAVMLMLHCRAWLDDHDDTRDDYKLPDPEINLVPLDGGAEDSAGGLVDVMMTIEFVDPVYIAEAENGAIEWNGRNFAPVAYDLWIAERGTVNQAPVEPD